MCPVTPSSKPNFENKRNEAARRSLRCRRSSSTLANLGGPGNPGFLTGAVAIRTSEEAKVSRAEYSTGHAAQRWWVTETSDSFEFTIERGCTRFILAVRNSPSLVLRHCVAPFCCAIYYDASRPKGNMNRFLACQPILTRQQTVFA